jgi:hypothetical protein
MGADACLAPARAFSFSAKASGHRAINCSDLESLKKTEVMKLHLALAELSPRKFKKIFFCRNKMGNNFTV